MTWRRRQVKNVNADWRLELVCLDGEGSREFLKTVLDWIAA